MNMLNCTQIPDNLKSVLYVGIIGNFVGCSEVFESYILTPKKLLHESDLGSFPKSLRQGYLMQK